MWAVVVGDSVASYGMPRLLAIRAAGFGIQMRVFFDLEKARHWLAGFGQLVEQSEGGLLRTAQLLPIGYDIGGIGSCHDWGTSDYDSGPSPCRVLPKPLDRELEAHDQDRPRAHRDEGGDHPNLGPMW